jgi:hypothetical protein
MLAASGARSFPSPLTCVRADIDQRGFTRRVLPFDVDVSRALADLAHAAWGLPRDSSSDGLTNSKQILRSRE